MRNTVYNQCKGKIIRRSIGGESARDMVLGESQVTSKQARKTKKGAAEMLELDDQKRSEGKGFLSIEQRAIYIKRAGKLYGNKKRTKTADPYEKRKDESTEQYIERLKVLANKC